jgi:transcriptional regulator with XRE-family HTH domain
MSTSEETAVHRLAVSLGATLARARAFRNLSQSDLASRVGIPTDHLAMIESGEDEQCDIRLAADIAAHLDFRLNLRMEPRE